MSNQTSINQFLLGHLTNFSKAIEDHKEDLERVLTNVAGGIKMVLSDIEVHQGGTDEDYNSVAKLLEKGVPLYHALLARVHRESKHLFKKIQREGTVNKTELARYFFADMVLIMTQGRSVGEDEVFIPSILINSYGFRLEVDKVKKYLYGNSFSKFNVEILYMLGGSLNFGKIGNRLGLGMAGTRYIQASLLMYCPNLEEERARNALAILRALNTIENKECLHSLNRSKDFTNVFGSINHVFFYLYTQYCDDRYKTFLKKNKSVYGNLVPGSQFIAYMKWDKASVATYVYGTSSENELRRIEFINKVNEEMNKINNKPFEIREVQEDQFNSDRNNMNT